MSGGGSARAHSDKAGHSASSDRSWRARRGRRRCRDLRAARRGPSGGWYFNREHAWFAASRPRRRSRGRRGGARGARRLRRHRGGARRGVRRARRLHQHSAARARARAPGRAGAGSRRPQRARNRPRRTSHEPARCASQSRIREQFDWPLFISVAALATLGVVNLYCATSVYRGRARRALYIQQIHGSRGAFWRAVIVAAIDYQYHRALRVRWRCVFNFVALLVVFMLGKADARDASVDRVRELSTSSRSSS